MGRPETILDALDATTRQRIDEAIRSAANRRPIDLYREFGLEGRGIKWRGFYSYCSRERKRLKRGAGSELPATGEPSSVFAKPRSIDTLSRLLNLLNQRIDAGDVKTMPHVSIAIRAINDCLRMTNDEQAEKRAAELHELKLKDLRTRFKAEVEAKTEGGKTLGREDVYDLIDKAMRGEQL